MTRTPEPEVANGGDPESRPSIAVPAAEIQAQLPYVISAHPISLNTSKAPALNRYLAELLVIPEEVAARVAWKLLVRAVAISDVEADLASGPGIRPLAAARHLLGLVEFAVDDQGRLLRSASIPGVGATPEELHSKQQQLGVSFYPFDPVGKVGQRRALAVFAGRWKSKDPRSLLVPRTSRQPQALQDLVASVWSRMEADLLVAAIVRPFVEEATQEQDDVATQSAPSTDLVIESTTGAYLPRLDAPANADDYPHSGWGPERQTFTLEAPAPYPSFNSITNNPNIGDERNFVGLRRADSHPDMLWQSHVWARAGDTFVVRVFVNNSGADNFHIVEAGWLQQAGIQLTLHSGKRGHAVHAFLRAVNAMTVWDGATIHTDDGARVEWEPGSFQIENNGLRNGVLPLDLNQALNGGVLLGYSQMDGFIQPGYQYSSYVSARLRIVAGAL